jgi:hypothetical protein
MLSLRSKPLMRLARQIFSAPGASSSHPSLRKTGAVWGPRLLLFMQRKTFGYSLLPPREALS